MGKITPTKAVSKIQPELPVTGPESSTKKVIFKIPKNRKVGYLQSALELTSLSKELC